MSYYETVEGKRVLDLENQITTLSANIYAAEYRWLGLLAQFDELGGWCGKGIKSFAHWLNWKCGISLAAGREKVRVARKLGELPLTSKAMSEGRLSYSKVRAITRIATAENEQDLLYIAENGTAEHLEKTVRFYRKAQAGADSITDANQANEQHEMKYLTYYYDTDGSMVFNARMPAEQGAQLIKALEAGTDLIFAEQRRVSAEASPDIANEVEARFDPARVSAETSRPPISSIRVDVLCLMAEGWLTHGPTAVSDGDRYQVVVHVDEDALQGSSEACGEIEGGLLISHETVRRLSTDSGSGISLRNSRKRAISSIKTCRAKARWFCLPSSSGESFFLPFFLGWRVTINGVAEIQDLEGPRRRFAEIASLRPKASKRRSKGPPSSRFTDTPKLVISAANRLKTKTVLHHYIVTNGTECNYAGPCGFVS